MAAKSLAALVADGRVRLFVVRSMDRIDPCSRRTRAMLDPIAPGTCIRRPAWVRRAPVAPGEARFVADSQPRSALGRAQSMIGCGVHRQRPGIACGEAFKSLGALQRAHLDAGDFAGRAFASDVWLVRAACALHGGETGQAVGNPCCLGGQEFGAVGLRADL